MKYAEALRQFRRSLLLDVRELFTVSLYAIICFLTWHVQPYYACFIVGERSARRPDGVAQVGGGIRAFLPLCNSDGRRCGEGVRRVRTARQSIH